MQEGSRAGGENKFAMGATSGRAGGTRGESGRGPARGGALSRRPRQNEAAGAKRSLGANRATAQAQVERSYHNGIGFGGAAERRRPLDEG